MEGLKPCPFCGKDANIIEDPPGWYFAECCYCGSRTAMTGKDNAVNLWNSRSKPAPVWEDAPFEVGSMIETVEPDKYGRVFQVIEELPKYMRLECTNTNLKGITMNRSKRVLKREWRIHT